MTTTPEYAVEAHGLCKRYGRRVVVDSVDLAVPAGVVAGFVGPNGAGKTTTLRMLLGLVRPTAGTARVLGRPLTSPGAYLSRVGALIESPAFYAGLSGTQNLAAAAVLAGHDRRQIPGLLDRVGLSGRGDDLYRTYSLGMKQRLGIAAALLGDPDLLILDEPTNGLDPGGIKEMRHLIRSLAQDGPTVLVSSHLLSELQQVCDWLVMIDHGRRVFEGTTEELLAVADGGVLLGAEHGSDLPRLRTMLDAHALTAVPAGNGLRVSVADFRTWAGDRPLGASLAELNREAFAAGITLSELTVSSSTLEDGYQALLEKEPVVPATRATEPVVPATHAKETVR